MILEVKGKEYVVRPTGTDRLQLYTDGHTVGTIVRISPTELELVGDNGFYRINGGSVLAIASKHYEDSTGISA